MLKIGVCWMAGVGFRLHSKVAVESDDVDRRNLYNSPSSKTPHRSCAACVADNNLLAADSRTESTRYQLKIPTMHI